MNLWSQDKGQIACAAAFVIDIRDGGIAPMSFPEIVDVSWFSVELAL